MADEKAESPSTLEVWTARLVEELGLPGDFTVDIGVILDLARDVAHSVARPAAPVSTFVVGYAAGLAAAGTPSLDARAHVDRLSAQTSALALGTGTPE